MLLALCYVKTILVLFIYQANMLGYMPQSLNSFRTLDLALLHDSYLSLNVVVMDLSVERSFNYWHVIVFVR